MFSLYFFFHCIISPSPAHKNTHSHSNINLKILAFFFFLLAHILTLNYQQNLSSNRLGRVSQMAKKKKKIAPTYISYVFLNSYNDTYHCFLHNNLRGCFILGTFLYIFILFNIGCLLDMQYNINNFYTTVICCIKHSQIWR